MSSALHTGEGDSPDVVVIVVSGVGDDASGSGRDGVVEALTTDPALRWKRRGEPGRITLVATADTGDTNGEDLATGIGAPNLRAPFAVPVTDVDGPNGQRVRVYEMFWADLSRAQGSVQRLFYLLFAITLQVSTIGREALAGLPDTDDAKTMRIRRWLGRALSAGSYWLVYVLTSLVVAMVGLAVTVNLLLLLNGNRVTSWAVLVLVGLIVVAAAWWIAERIYRGGWTFDRPDAPWAYTPQVANPWPSRAVIALGVGLAGAAFWLGLASQKEFPLQLTYLLLVASAASAIGVATATRAPVDDPQQGAAGRRRVRRVICGGFAAVPAGAMVLAAAAGDLVGNPPVSNVAGGGVTARAATALTMVSFGAFRFAWIVLLVLTLACALLATALRFRRAPADEHRRVSATVMLALMLGPLLYAIGAATAFLVFAALSRFYPDYAKTWPGNYRPRALGDTFYQPLNDGSTKLADTAAWGYAVVRGTIQPVGVGLVCVSVALVVLGVFFRRYLRSFRARNRYASAADVSIDQGNSFTRAFMTSGSDGIYCGIYVVMVALAVLAAIVFWTVPWAPIQDLGDGFAKIAVPLAYALAVMAIAGIGLRNVGIVGRLGGGFTTNLGRALDLVYDITTYLRAANPAIVPPRVQMVARYRAVLRRVASERPKHVVVMAHSQGTILTLAALLGDRNHSPRFGPPAGAEAPPAPLTFLSYGSPVMQTYEQRFPTRFQVWTSPHVLADSVITRWLNVFRAGDYIGRGVGEHDSYDPAVTTSGVHLQERCLGPGHHTGYLVDERWRRVARHVVAAPHTAQLADVDLGDLTVVIRDGPPNILVTPPPVDPAA
jgi:hypothetical protein